MFSYAVNLVIQPVLSPELVAFLVSSQFSKLLVSRRHVRPEEPPRPVCPTGGRGEEKTRPSVAVLQQFSSTRVLQFNKCYVGNAIQRRPHCVIFSPVHPKRCKGSGPVEPTYTVASIAVYTAPASPPTVPSDTR